MASSKQAQLEKTLTGAYRDFEKNLNSYAFFKTHDRGVSEEIVQDAFMKTWRYLVRGGKVDVMKSFLYHILNDLIVDEYRKHKATSLDVLMDQGFDPGVDGSKRLFNFLDGKRAISLIQWLPRIYRKVMRMRYVQDLSLEEISAVTGQSRNTVAVQLHRGLKKLKLLYGQ